MMTNIYILKLSERKWYVGKADDVKKRYQQHLNGNGSSWTKKYTPISLEKTITNASHFDEDKVTKEYMAKYGIENVRGGSYCSIDLDDSQIETLNREIWMAQDKCTRCGRSTHFVSRCYASTDINGNDLDLDEEKPIDTQLKFPGFYNPLYGLVTINTSIQARGATQAPSKPKQVYDETKRAKQAPSKPKM